MQLVNELNEMVRFINTNNEVVNKVLEEEVNELKAADNANAAD